MGGSDQWGNIYRDRVDSPKSRRRSICIYLPTITKADGGKFGKTEEGNVWLDAEKTSPFQFYQFWLNAADADAEKWIRIFTFLGQEEIEQLIQVHRQDASKRELQKRLAQELTIFVHGEEEYYKAIETTNKLFAQQSAPAESFSIEDLENMQGIVRIGYAREKLSTGVDAVSFLSETGIFPSKGEARKMIQNGGVSINRNKIETPTDTVNDRLLLHGKYLLIQKGKKHYYLLSAE